MKNWLLISFSASLIALVGIVLSVGGCSSESKKAKRQQFARGQILYERHCQRCHKKDGEGFKELYPPLNQADYMENNEDLVACIIKYGMNGRVMVNGKAYNLKMTGNKGLSDHDITQIMTYIYNAWDNDRSKFEVQAVKQALSSCDSMVRME